MFFFSHKKNIATAKRSWLASCSTLVTPQVLSSQPTMIVNNRFRRSHLDDYSWQHLRSGDGRALLTTAVVWRQNSTDGRINISYLKPEYPSVHPSIHPGTCGGSKCSNRISGANFYIVFHSNNESILLSFRDDHGKRAIRTTDGRWTDYSNHHISCH